VKPKHFIAVALLLLACRLATPWSATPTPSPGQGAGPTARPSATPGRTAASGNSLLPASTIFDSAWDDRSAFTPGLVASEQPVLGLYPGMSMYHLDLTISDDLNRVSGLEQVRYTNTESVPLDKVDFRLYPNILGGAMTVTGLTVNGAEVGPSYGLESSVLTVPLPQPLKPGEQAVIAMRFDVAVPASVDQNYGVFSSAGGVLAYAHGYPVIAVFDEAGWNAEIPPQWGDVTVADASYYRARISAPEALQVAASGRELSRRTEAGRQVIEVAAGPARDFYFVAGTAFAASAREVGEVKLQAFAPTADAPRVESALDAAQAALQVYSQHYGPYPYTELDLALTPTYALGIEYPGVIALNEQLFTPTNDFGALPEPVLLESTVAHEVGHQWFYNLVGNNQLEEPWLDEALAQFATWQYYSDTGGPIAAQGFKASLEARWARVDNEPIPVGLPVRDYDPLSYGAIVYGRGPLFLDALRDKMGSDTFDAFILDYALTNRWQIATTQGFKGLAEQHCACDLTTLFAAWIYP